MSVCVWESEEDSVFVYTCLCVCVCICNCVCVISSLKRQLHAEFLNGESFSVMTTKWHTRLSNLFSPLLSFFLSFPLSFVFSLSPLCWVVVHRSVSYFPHVSVVLSSSPLFLLHLFPPSYLDFLPLLLSFALLHPNHHNHLFWGICCSALQNETHLSQLNLHKTLNRSRREGRKGRQRGLE